MKAISAAHADGVDVLNISNGTPAAPDDPAAPANQEIDKLTRRGPTVVASCGNYIENNVKKPTRPAKNKNVIGVSGYEPKCEFDDEGLPADLNDGRYSVMMPDLNDASSSTIYCGYENYDSGDCMTCSQCSLDETAWDGNVDPLPDKDKPDVLAPVIYPAITDSSLRRKPGTSYAAPMVAAAIGRCLSVVAEERNPTSVEIRDKITQTGVDIGAEQGCKPDIAALETALRPSSGPSVLSDD